MTNQLRKGVETLKLFYIIKLIQAGYASEQELQQLNLSELEEIFKKVFIQKERCIQSSLLQKHKQCKEN
jgi:hypothetical protein